MVCTLSTKMVGGEKNFTEKSCGGSGNFDFKERFYYGVTYFFEGRLQGIFGENRKLHNCNIINENMFQRIQYALMFIMSHSCTQMYFRTVESA